MTRVERRDVGRRVVLAVLGELDVATAVIVAKAIDSALEDRALELWIDLSETSFMDSAGLHLLLDARRRLDVHGGTLAIICPEGRIRRVFQLAGVAAELPVYDDRAAAHAGG